MGICFFCPLRLRLGSFLTRKYNNSIGDLTRSFFCLLVSYSGEYIMARFIFFFFADRSPCKKKWYIFMCFLSKRGRKKRIDDDKFFPLKKRRPKNFFSAYTEQRVMEADKWRVKKVRVHYGGGKSRFSLFFEGYVSPRWSDRRCTGWWWDGTRCNRINEKTFLCFMFPPKG